MTDRDDRVVQLIDEFRDRADDSLYPQAYDQIATVVYSPVAFTPHERLDRIRAVIEAVEAVRAERA